MSRPAGRGPAAEKPLGEIVSEVSQKVTVLVREEIELAKTEVGIKAGRLARGAAAGAAAGVFLIFALIYFFHALAYLIESVGVTLWLSYFIVFLLLVALGAVAGLLALRFVKRGTPPTPEMAIEEAKKTRQALEEARH